MYINDLPDKITQGEAYLYADDSTLYNSGKNIEEVVDNLNMIGKQVNDWCQENQLTEVLKKVRSLDHNKSRFHRTIASSKNRK